MQIKPSAVSLSLRLQGSLPRYMPAGTGLGLGMMWTEGPGVVTAGRTCKGADQLEP